MKDNFSLNSKQYAQYRPVYPKSLYQFIFSQVQERNYAWDAGTGNGQVAGVLADHFSKVFATDISENQILNAVKRDNIIYLNEAAERTTLTDNTLNLITVAQAIHWFNFSEFNKEVYRTLKPGGILAIFGYSLFRTETEADLLIEDFYFNILQNYWDPERQFIEEKYKTIPFPYQEIPAPDLKMEVEWSLQELIGYLNTWSAVQHFIQKNNYNPVDELALSLQKIWKNKSKILINFPLILRIGSFEN
ncbi:class I SAM-dependent methyltransferase [soil metagenome]